MEDNNITIIKSITPVVVANGNTPKIYYGTSDFYFNEIIDFNNLYTIITTEDKVVQEVCKDLNSRSLVGQQKYNTTLERTDLNLKDWLQHAYEECLDQANYLKRAIIEIENEIKIKHNPNVKTNL